VRIGQGKNLRPREWIAGTRCGSAGPYYRRLHVLVRREGFTDNHKRVYRIYRHAGLAVRRRRKRDRIAVPRVPLIAPALPNECWSMDFVFDGKRAATTPSLTV